MKLPMNVENLQHQAGLPFLSYWSLENKWLVAQSLLSFDELTVESFEGYDLPIVSKGAGKNRRFQVNYYLEDVGPGPEAGRFFESILPLQLFARLHGLTDAQHNNYVIKRSGKVYMVDHMNQLYDADIYLRGAERDGPRVLLKLLYGSRPPPAKFVECIKDSLRKWRSSDDWEEFWVCMATQVDGDVGTIASFDDVYGVKTLLEEQL